MIKNYLKTAWRNLVRTKGYSALNIVGLATGMSVALLIGLWVYNEYSYDKFIPQYEQLYQVKRNFNSNGEILTFPTTSLKLADALRKQVPEIEYVAETDWMGAHGLIVGNKKLYKKGGIVGSDFLKMFQFPLLEGDRNSALNDSYSIVLTASLAHALFGNENAIGKMIRFDNNNNLKVTGILNDLPAASSFQFNFLVPFSYLEQTITGVKNDRTGSFSGNSYQQFVKLKPGITLAQVTPRIKDIEKTETENTNAMLSEVVLHPMKDWHLFGEYKNGYAADGFIQYVRMFTVIGALVLLIACINFINLTTARSEKRAKEVGVRKAIGSLRSDLMIQFLLESFLLTAVAFLLAVVFVQLSLSPFNTLTGNSISIPYTNGVFWSILLACVLLTALVAGSRPAFYLSSFNAVKVLKGDKHAGNGGTLGRKILVVLQFSCSIALIISTIIIYKQINYARERPMGYNINGLMLTDMNNDLNKNFSALKNELLQQGVVENITTSTSPFNNIDWHSDIDHWPGKNADETVEMGIIVTSDDYFKTLGIAITQGRDFSSPADTANVVLNEAAVRRLRLKQPINQILINNGSAARIIGVAKDALMLSPFMPADPTMFLYSSNPQGNLMYRLAPGIKTSEAIKRLTAIFNNYNPAYPYNYQFADASYEAKFHVELLVGKLSALFAGLAIFISSLGLFGLAAYVAEQRTKEIGIRKVLGASVSQVWVLLSKEFIVLVLISCVIATPVALYFLQAWLQKYSYRINIGAGVFIVSALMAVFITIITISFQAIRAAVANPVRSLRTE